MQLFSRCCGFGFANQFHIHRGIVFTVLWNWLVKPIPWCRGIGSHIFNNIIIVIINIIIMNMNKTQNLKAYHYFVCTLVSNCIIDRWQCIIPLSSSSPSSSSAVAVRRRRRCHQHHPHRHYHHHNLLLSCIPRIRNFSSNTSSRPLSVHRAMLQVSTCPQGWKWGACN